MHLKSSLSILILVSFPLAQAVKARFPKATFYNDVNFGGEFKTQDVDTNICYEFPYIPGGPPSMNLSRPLECRFYKNIKCQDCPINEPRSTTPIDVQPKRFPSGDYPDMYTSYPLTKDAAAFKCPAIGPQIADDSVAIYPNAYYKDVSDGLSEIQLIKGITDNTCYDVDSALIRNIGAMKVGRGLTSCLGFERSGCRQKVNSLGADPSSLFFISFDYPTVSANDDESYKLTGMLSFNCFN